MNIYLFIASLLTMVLVLAHSILGEIKIFKHLKNAKELPVLKGIPLIGNLDDAARHTLRFVWHIASVLAGSIAAILFYSSTIVLSTSFESLVIVAISVAMFICSIVTLTFSKGRHTAWIAFLIIGVLCALGLL